MKEQPKNQKKTSIRNLAKVLNVSPTTISLGLKNSTRISESLRGKIHSLAKQMNYHRNQWVDSIINDKTDLIGCIFHDINEGFQGGICAELLDSMYKENFVGIIYNHHNDWERERNFILDGIEKRVEGFIIFPTLHEKNDDYFRKLKDLNIPFILVDNTMPGMKCNMIETDDEKGAFELTNYLISLGHEKILHVSGDLANNSALKRIAGYKQAIRSSKLPLHMNSIYYGHYQVKNLQVNKEEILKVIYDYNPSAIFAGNDYVAQYIIRLLMDEGYSIPDDISIAGYGGLIDYVIGNKKLTTIHQPIEKISQKIIQCILTEISQKRKGKNVNKGITEILDTKLIKGDTCKKILL
jgi:LacI family transcriptional regulator, galactose operon repressor